jgi:hypothetical protein
MWRCLLERKARRIFMNIILKSAGAAALVGAVALASMTPSEARNRWIGPAAAGFAAGAIVGSAAAGAYGYRGGYYDPGYAYGSGYDAYAYESPTYVAPTYVEPTYAAPTYYYGYGRDRSNCGRSPGNYGQSVDRSACNQ